MAVDRQPEDEQNFKSGGRSTVDERTGVSASTEAEMERMMIRIFKRTICPMIRGDVNALQQEFFSQIKEELHSTSMTGNSVQMASKSGSQTLQLQFRNGISTPIFTGMNIEGKDHKPFVVALVDGISGQIVNTGDGAAAKVEIVVIKGDCDDEEVESWTHEDFNNKIISEWKGKKILQGNIYLNLKDGIGSVGEISFKQNSVWTKNNKCRLGARFEDAVFATSVKEAKTESFLVKDKRCLLYNKHQTPSLSDEVWRLEKISRRGACHIRLREEGIKTVKDFLTLNAINPKRLKDILRVSPKIWKAIVNHAQTCKDDKGVYLYRDVAFNVSGQLMGLVVESHYVPSDKLSDDKKGDAQELVVSSSENWKEVISFDDEASLIDHLQPQIAFHSSQSPSNGLNLVIPQAIADHTSPITSPRVITPILPIGCTNNVTNVCFRHRDCGNGIECSVSRSFQLQFLSALSLPVFTGTRIEGGDCNTLKVALIDAQTGKTVSCGIESSAKVEIVALEGHFDDDVGDNWTRIVSERQGKKSLLNGNVLVNLNEGIGLVGDLFFTDNSSWTRSRKFRLGARVLDNCNGIRVREAKSESFVVRDPRGELYKKNHRPYLSDERLEKIGKEGAFHRRLNKENVKIIKDFLVLFFLDSERLRHILGSGMSNKMWEVTVEHARGCVLYDSKLYLYCPQCQKRDGVVFNVVGQVLGLLSDCKYIVADALSETDKAEAHKLVISAFQHSDEIVPYDDGSSFRNGTCFLTEDLYPSNAQMGNPEGNKTKTSRKRSRFDYPQMRVPSPDVVSLGEYGLKRHGLHRR